MRGQTLAAKRAKKDRSNILYAHASGAIGRAKTDADTKQMVEDAIKAGKLTKCKASGRKPDMRRRSRDCKWSGSN